MFYLILYANVCVRLHIYNTQLAVKWKFLVWFVFEAAENSLNHIQVKWLHSIRSFYIQISFIHFIIIWTGWLYSVEQH